MADTFAALSSGLESPGDDHFDAGAQASDTLDFPIRPRALRFNIAGVVALRSKSGVVISYTVAAGEVMPFRAQRMMATGTDAGLKAAGATVGWY